MPLHSTEHQSQQRLGSGCNKLTMEPRLQATCATHAELHNPAYSHFDLVPKLGLATHFREALLCHTGS